MNQILVMIGVVAAGCANDTREAAPDPAPHTPEGEPKTSETAQAAGAEKVARQSALEEEVVITHPLVRAAVLKSLKKPSGKFAPPVKFTKRELTGVTELYFLEGLIDDAGLKEVAKFQNLKILAMNRTKITDAGIKSVAKLQQLQTLAAAGTEITDACLEDIAKLKNLRKFILYGTKITDEGAEELQKALPACGIFGPRS